jgi:hypothetical protein
MSLEAAEFVANNNMVIVPRSSFSPALAPCAFALFPKLKMKLKERRFETVSDIQRESQAVLDSIKVNDFHGVLMRGKNDRITVYIPKEMAAKIEKVRPEFLFLT